MVYELSITVNQSQEEEKRKKQFFLDSTSYFLNLVYISQSFLKGIFRFLSTNFLKLLSSPEKKILLSAQPFAKLLVLEKIKKDSYDFFFFFFVNLFD